MWGREKWGREGVGQSPPFPAAVLPRWGAEWVCEGTGRSKRIKLSRQKGREMVNASANLNFCLNPPFYQNDVRHSVTFGRQTLLTFDKVDRVEHVQLWRQRRLRQIGDKLDKVGSRQLRRLSTLSPRHICTDPYAEPTALTL